MQTIAILNQKGGAGKSTLSECLAVAAVQSGLSAAILDLDPQGTVAAWARRRKDEEPAVAAVTEADCRAKWELLAEAGADLCVIDTPARLQGSVLDAADLADLVVVPSKPTIKDVERIAASLRLAGTRKDVPALVVLNQLRPHGGRLDAAKEALGPGIRVCPDGLGFRVAYEDSDIEGRTPTETQPSGKAAEEIRAVWRYIQTMLDDASLKEAS